ncbi:RNase H family protein [Streptomyces tendae]|uniref:RNase H family protein n=1 Tax=Streptomyces tendae TaxID=1932 RepID=UPI0024911292|nr:RNase H family protein [Streptomyces tendae]
MITGRTELIRHLADDFTSLQEAVLARMNGVCSPEIAEALEHASLAGPITVALAHADVIARGSVRRAELSAQPAERLRPLRLHARRVRRARSQAEAVCKEQRARHLAARARPTNALELRVVRAAYPAALDEALREELRARGLPDGTPQAPEADLTRWAWERKTASGGLPAPVRELRDCDGDAFVQALLRDAREEENPHLPHHAVVERWSRHARTALAWGRYAIGRAERDVLGCRPSERCTSLDALEDAYQDTAVLAARAREARMLVTELHDRMRANVTTGPFAELVADCRAAGLVGFADAEPLRWRKAREVTERHREHCPERADGCPRCHRDLAAALADAEPAELAGSGACWGGELPAAVPRADEDRYALLADLPDTAVVAVADAALGDESAVCGYGWAAEDGTSGCGDALASSSGEAEVIAICTAALSLLEQHVDALVVLLCDSLEAVEAANAALRAGDSTAAHRTLLFLENRSLMGRLLPHRHRIQIRWLKGHIGHDLNESADALARLALRRATGRIAYSAARKEQTRILRSLGAANGVLPTAA